MPENLHGLLKQPVFFIFLTVTLFYLSQQLYQKYKVFIFHPVLVTISSTITILLLLNIDYATYNKGGRIISFLLGPAVVALGVPLHQQMERIKKQGLSIFVAITLGSIVGVLSASGTVYYLGGSTEVLLSIAPRSVTTPIAIGISNNMGGLTPLTTAFVVFTGILGAIIGPALLKIFGIKSKTAIGLALGATSHGIGTVRALEEGKTEGASAGLAICLMGIATALLCPTLIKWLLIYLN